MGIDVNPVHTAVPKIYRGNNIFKKLGSSLEPALFGHLRFRFLKKRSQAGRPRSGCPGYQTRASLCMSNGVLIVRHVINHHHHQCSTET